MPSNAATIGQKAWRRRALSIARRARRCCRSLKNITRDNADLLLLMIDPALLSSDLKWEPPSGGAPPPGVPEGELFPHVYGPINLDAIVKVLDLETNPDGKHNVPALD